MPESEIYGPIVGGDDVEAAVLTTLQTWLPAYLAEVSRRDGRDANALPAPKAWITDDEADSFMGGNGQLPAVVISCPGLADKAVKDGGRNYRAPWAVIVGVIVKADTQENTHKLARLYAKALRWIMVQKGDHAGFARGTTWEDEEYDYGQEDDGRTLAAARVTFEVEVADVASGLGGPLTVPADPYALVPDDPTVGEGLADVTMEAGV